MTSKARISTDWILNRADALLEGIDAQHLGKAVCRPFMHCLPERCLVPREGAVGGDAGAGVAALQLSALCGPSVHL
jgi:hypothetical protein